MEKTAIWIINETKIILHDKTEPKKRTIRVTAATKMTGAYPTFTIFPFNILSFQERRIFVESHWSQQKLMN